MARPNPAPDLPLAALLVGALALRLGLAAGLPGLYRPDEVFQTLEPAHALLDGWGVLAWEWHAGARNWVFPGLIAVVMALGTATGGGADIYLPALSALLALLSLSSMWAAYRIGCLGGGRPAGLLAAAITAVWPDLLYFAARPLPEVVGAHCVLLALAFALGLKRPGAAGFRRAALATGALLGLGFAVRIHMAPAIAVIGLWSLGRGWRVLPPMLAGAALPLLAMGVSDWISWGVPFGSIWAYYRAQVIEGFSSHDGVMSGWFYLLAPLAAWGPWAAAVAVLAAIGALAARPRPIGVVLAVIIAVVGFHSAFAFKLFSYIYLALPPLLALAAVGSLRLLGGGRVVLAAMLWLGIAAGVAARAPEREAWQSFADYRGAFTLLRAWPELCGVAGYGGDWWVSYALLDRKVPAFLDRRGERRAAIGAAANAYLVSPALAGAFPEATKLRCGPELCVLVRPGACVPSPEDEIGAVLRREGF